MTDLVVSGGTVVTATGSSRADVAVDGGRITAVGEGVGQGAHERIDATGMLVLPGVVDVHTHTRLPSPDQPDRFFADSVAAAFGGTTTFLSFNNPGTGISDEGSQSLLAGMREFRARTEGESAVDFGLSAVITGQQADPIAELPELIASGVPTAKAFMVYDFRLSDERLLAALRVMGRHGGMLQQRIQPPAIGRGGHLHRQGVRPTHQKDQQEHMYNVQRYQHIGKNFAV